MNGFANAYEYVKKTFYNIVTSLKIKLRVNVIFSSACGIICIINAICQFISYNIVSNDIKKKNFFT